MQKNKIFVLIAIFAIIFSFSCTVMADSVADTFSNPDASPEELVNAITADTDTILAEIGVVMDDSSANTSEILDEVVSTAFSMTNAANAIISFLVGIITIVAKYFVFRKAGYKGWYSIIPIYSDYVLFKFAWNTKAFWRNFIYTCGSRSSNIVSRWGVHRF